jgi:TPR repeat protein
MGTADLNRVSGETRAREHGMLPEGFVPIRQAKGLFQLGTWPKLVQDGAPAFFPLQTLLAMARRNRDKDADAAAWMQLYMRATKGEVQAQLEMGKVCETGGFGAPVDPQRAFFWFRRAALHGSAEAQAHAQRLSGTLDIDPATRAEPSLISGGLWTVLADNPARGVTRSLFAFEQDGSLKGRVLDVGGEAMRTINAVSRYEPGLQDFIGNVFMSLRYKGRWSYDRERLLLTLKLHTYAEGLLGPGQDETLKIEMLGVSGENAVFGRDEKQIGYTLRRPTQEDGDS